jgi:NAD(P)-dependent dehydrogenase (short-subunit alcohol dehydrogenase family)
MERGDLGSQVAVVTGASRGIGRGVALALADVGATVYVTGRSALNETVRLAEGRRGHVAAVPCDHRDDDAVRAAFDTVAREAGRLDLLVNNATAVPDLSFLFSDRPFWELGAEAWDDLMAVGLRSHFIAAQCAARMMIQQRRGLIVNISSAGAKTKIGIVPYGVGKAALDHMTREMAEELRSYGVGVVSVWPPPSRTEGMVAGATDKASVAAWSSTEFTGRVIAALAAEDPLARTGEVLPVRPLAAEFAIDDDAELSS